MIFTDRFLIKRPLLQALRASNSSGPPVLLIDEVDRTDEPFRGISCSRCCRISRITIPEIGTIKAEHPPVVVITSNRTREIHDALKRRCFYYWVDYPDAKREPRDPCRRQGAWRGRGLVAQEVVAFVQKAAHAAGPVQAAGRGRDDHRLGATP